MEKNKISVIVVAYQVSQYIDRCLESISNQTYENLEIIVVAGTNPNGHDDECLSKCRRAAAKDSRIKIVTCVAAGVSDARNRGLMAATGDLIGFVDGDDYIDRDMYTHMAQLLVKHRADTVVCGRYYEYRDATLSDPLPERGAIPMNSQKALEVVLSDGGFFLHCWDKLYKASLWEGVSFPIDRKVEDRIVVNQILGKAEKIVYDSTPKYHFRERSGSLSKTGDVAKQNTIANETLASFIYENYPSLAMLCDRFMVYEYITAIQNVYLSGKVNKEEVAIYKSAIVSLLGKAAMNKYFDWKLWAKVILALNAPGILAANTKRKNKKNERELIRFS